MSARGGAVPPPSGFADRDASAGPIPGLPPHAPALRTFPRPFPKSAASDESRTVCPLLASCSSSLVSYSEIARRADMPCNGESSRSAPSSVSSARSNSCCARSTSVTAMSPIITRPESERAATMRYESSFYAAFPRRGRAEGDLDVESALGAWVAWSSPDPRTRSPEIMRIG